jgi:hypothetical protein
MANFSAEVLAAVFCIHSESVGKSCFPGYYSLCLDAFRLDKTDYFCAAVWGYSFFFVLLRLVWSLPEHTYRTLKPEHYENKILLSSPCSLPDDCHVGTATKHYLRDRHGQ